ncbi:hypothetical protein I4U23_023012 [Adineta vaga]|nr:hypothetical protein I4U23_023012 [Adineta vaga]
MNNRPVCPFLRQLQDRLTDDDRKRLCFYVGTEVPKGTTDPSPTGTTSRLDFPLTQDKINREYLTCLINNFKEIGCFDAAESLKEYLDRNESLQSLSSIMPSRIDLLLCEDDD